MASPYRFSHRLLNTQSSLFIELTLPFGGLTGMARILSQLTLPLGSAAVCDALHFLCTSRLVIHVSQIKS